MTVDFSKLNDDEMRRYLALFNLRDERIKFATKYHKNTNGQDLSFDGRFKYMREIYQTLAEKLVLMSGTQLGKSEWMVVDMLAASNQGLSSLMCFPKKDFAKRYVKEKVKRPLSVSPQYQAILKESLSDSVDLINFGKGMISFVSANNSEDFTSYSAHAYYVEELDQADSLENVELGFARLSGSIFSFFRLVANPLTTAKGRVYDWYQKSDKRVWKCPCKKCGVFSELNWFESVIEEIKDDEDQVIGHVLRDKDWYAGCGRDIRMICPICKEGELDRRSEESYWEATAYSEQNITGYHMPQMISTLHDITKLYFQYKEALDDPTAMGKFYSTVLALPYTVGGNRISTNLLQRCAENNKPFIIKPDEAYLDEVHDGPCSMGVDQNGSTLDVRISATENGRRKAVYFGKFNVENTEKLHDLIERYNVYVAVIDNEPNTVLSKAFQQRAKCDVFRTKYSTSHKQTETKYDYNKMFITVHRTVALDRGYSQLKTRKNILPSNFEVIFKGLYKNEMEALTRQTTEMANGDLVHHWTKSRDDHARHADAYDLLGWELLNQDYLLGNDAIYTGN